MATDNDLEYSLKLALPDYSVRVEARSDPYPPYHVLISKGKVMVFDENYSAPELYTILFDFNKKVK